MVDLCIIVGGSGAIGRGFVASVTEQGIKFMVVRSLDIIRSFEKTVDRIRLELSTQLSKCPTRRRSIGVILAHRYRGEDLLQALKTELIICRDFVWSICQAEAEIRVMVIGSVTGGLLDVKMSEAYHYAKDLQKSIVRQSCRLENLSMNLLELYHVNKYSPDTYTRGYEEYLAGIATRIGDRNIPIIWDVVDFTLNMFAMRTTPRGQIITYDGGYSIFQG